MLRGESQRQSSSRMNSHKLVGSISEPHSRQSSRPTSKQSSRATSLEPASSTLREHEDDDNVFSNSSHHGWKPVTSSTRDHVMPSIKSPRGSFNDPSAPSPRGITTPRSSFQSAGGSGTSSRLSTDTLPKLSLKQPDSTSGRTLTSELLLASCPALKTMVSNGALNGEKSPASTPRRGANGERSPCSSGRSSDRNVPMSTSRHGSLTNRSKGGELDGSMHGSLTPGQRSRNGSREFDMNLPALSTARSRATSPALPFTSTSSSDMNMPIPMGALLHLDVNGTSGFIDGTKGVPTEDIGHWEFMDAASHGDVELVTKILGERKVDINKEDSVGTTAVWRASWDGLLDMVKLLVRHGADVNFATLNGQGYTCVHAAAQDGHVPVVRYLKEHGADVNQKHKAGWTPLWKAARAGQLPVVKYLTSVGADIDTTDLDGFCALGVAAECGNFSTVQYLVHQGANVNLAAHKTGCTPLMMACASGLWAEEGHFECVQFLLENGAEMDLEDCNGHSAEDLSHDCLQPLFQLLHYDIHSPECLTCLQADYYELWINMVKVRFQSILVKQFLSIYPNDLREAKDEEGYMARDLASEFNKEFFEEDYFTRPPPVVPVVEEVKVQRKKTMALLDAARLGELTNVEHAMSKQGVKVNVTDTFGWSPLFEAVQGGHLDVVKYLVQNGADVFQIDSAGWTPLYVACNEGHIEIVKFLTQQAGVDVTKPDKLGRTCLDLCQTDMLRTMLTEGFGSASDDEDSDEEESKKELTMNTAQNATVSTHELSFCRKVGGMGEGGLTARRMSVAGRRVSVAMTDKIISGQTERKGSLCIVTGFKRMPKALRPGSLEKKPEAPVRNPDQKHIMVHFCMDRKARPDVVRLLVEYLRNAHNYDVWTEEEGSTLMSKPISKNALSNTTEDHPEPSSKHDPSSKDGTTNSTHTNAAVGSPLPSARNAPKSSRGGGGHSQGPVTKDTPSDVDCLDIPKEMASVVASSHTIIICLCKEYKANQACQKIAKYCRQRKMATGAMNVYYLNTQKNYTTMSEVCLPLWDKVVVASTGDSLAHMIGNIGKVDQVISRRDAPVNDETLNDETMAATIRTMEMTHRDTARTEGTDLTLPTTSRKPFS